MKYSAANESDCDMLDVGSSKGSLINMNGSLGEEGDTLANMDGAWTKNRKMTDWEMPGQGRQRKISHRKVIIHDDGEICNRTYNKAGWWRHHFCHHNYLGSRMVLSMKITRKIKLHD